MFNDQNDKRTDPPPRSPLPGGKPNPLTLFLLLAVAGVFIAYFFKGNTSSVREIRYSDFINYLEQNQIESVTINDNNTLDITLRPQSQQGAVQLRTRIPYTDPDLLPKLREKNVNISGAAARMSPLRLVMDILPWAIFIFFIFFLLRNMPGGGNKVFQFGKSRAKRYQDEGKKVLFDDVAGQKDAKYELEEVVEFLKNP
ncbi:MAG: ATP-dependent metallopeptidase FtsH/Yme1/Tma family protein, partial [Treponema sp.]|nr:ATP-dependent metallopeptidase FtsH/Yme1/Tma family protein [Treponema sp.]